METIPKSIIAIILFFFLIDGLVAQPSTFIDEKGVWRWTESGEEVTAFGANYSMPFCSWEEHEQLGHFNQEAIDADVYHLTRMGLDGYRIHLWEADITDFEGNLIFNKHFQLFDYLLYKLKERNFKIFITAMRWDGSPGSSGYANKYGNTHTERRHRCLTDTAAWPDQENYLAQLVSHINPYTEIAYKDDPDIIGFEINNEPVAHSARPDLTREYIDRMSAAIRSTGCEKPLFYNVSHNIDQIDAFCAEEIQGGTFQWYPTALAGNHDLQGNYLPAVDQYIIPFADHPRFKNMSKLAYELCPSDVGRSSFMYPAMARSLRESGFQFAAQFAYLGVNVAWSNFRWQTHFLNLAYTPEKAMGMMIAKEAFHRLPLGKSYGRYPYNNTFDLFRVDYEEGLAEMVSDDIFLYTTNTKTSPPNPKILSQVAGVGSSPIVNYPGTGTYFLDKLREGVWRLEVMPDAIWVGDPHFATAIDREVSVVQWREWLMGIKLPDLGENFSILGLNDGNKLNTIAKEQQFTISPGAYLLTRDGMVSEWKGSDKIRNIRMDEFYAPTAHCKETYVVHEPPVETSAGGKLILTARIVSPEGPEKVELVIVKELQHTAIPMEETTAYHYTAEVPANFLEASGLLRYYITVGNGEEYETFPIKFKGNHPLNRRLRPQHTDFLPGNPYQIKIMNENAPITIYESARDWEKITRKDSNINPDISPNTGKIVTAFTLSGRNSELAYQHFCGDRIEMRADDLDNKAELAVYGYALNDKPCKLGITLIMKDATAYSGTMIVKTVEGRHALPLNNLKLQKLRIIPFQIPQSTQFFKDPQYIETQKPSEFSLDEVESLQFIVYPENTDNKADKADGLAIERISLE